MTDPAQVTESQVAHAREVLARGYTLAEAAQRVGVARRALDVALWWWMGDEVERKAAED